MELTDTQFERYARHLILDEVGEEGQARLLSSRVLVVGAGGLGTPLLLYLAAAGVGTLGVIDDDVVDLSNLQRQVIHTTERVGRPKVESAAAMLAAVNPDVRVIPLKARLTADNAAAIIADYDLVADGSDNFTTRFLLNDACFLRGKTLASAALLRFDAQISIYKAHLGPSPSLLSLPVPGAAARRPDSPLRAGRYPRRPRRHRRLPAGDRSPEGTARHRRESLGASADLRRARDDLPQDQGEARPRLRPVRPAGDDQGSAALRAEFRCGLAMRWRKELSDGAPDGAT